MSDSNDTNESRLSLDKVLLVVALLLFIGSLGALVFDELHGADGDGGAAIGKVSSSVGDVRRRAHSGVAWSDMREGQSVVEGDSVFLGDGAGAKIELQEGQTIELEAKSLLVIRSSKSQLELDLRYGALKGSVDSSTSSRKLVLKTDGQKQEIAGSGAEFKIIRAERERAPRVEVLKGQLEVRRAKGPTAIVKQAETARLDPKSSEIKAVRTLGVELLEPPADAKIQSPSNKPTLFKWKSTTPGRFVVEVAKDSSFSSIVSSSPATADGQASLSDLPRGTGLRWRVRAAEGDATPSSARSLSLLSDEPPRLDVPAEGQSLAVPADAESVLARFSWTDSSGSKSFTLQIARAEAGFDRPAVEKSVESSALDGVELREGRYLWRVAATPSEGRAPSWARARTFVVVGAKKLMPPTLKIPALGFSIPATSIERSNRGGALTAKPPGLPALEWTAAPGADHYVLERASNSEFSDVQKTELRETKFPLGAVAPSTLHWRVRSASADGRLSDPSAVGVWTLKGAAPVTKETAPISAAMADPKALSAAAASFKFEWTPTPWSLRHELEIGTDQDFSDPASHSAQGKSVQVRISRAGDFWWRVRAVSPSGAPLTDWSTPRKSAYRKDLKVDRKVAVAPIPTPAPTPGPAPTPPPVVEAPPTAPAIAAIPSGPIPIEPRPSTPIVSVAGAASFIQFRWSNIKGASGYEWEFSRNKSFTSDTKSAKTKRNQHFLNEPLPSGVGYWRIRAVVKGTPTAWSAPSIVKIESH